jgi:hypothetical protein
MNSGPSRRADERGCGRADRNGRLPSLEAIVRAYNLQFRKHSREELESFAAEPLPKAIRRAGLAQRLDGRRYNHQRRIPRRVLQVAAGRLSRMNLDAASSFDELHQLVHAAIGAIDGIGRPTVYDTALRIGAALRHSPDRVYLHAGTRAGARKLGLNWRKDSLSMSEIPRALQKLEPREIEDVLCIFADHFNPIMKTAG